MATVLLLLRVITTIKLFASIYSGQLSLSSFRDRQISASFSLSTAAERVDCTTERMQPTDEYDKFTLVRSSHLIDGTNHRVSCHVGRSYKLWSGHRGVIVRAAMETHRKLYLRNSLRSDQRWNYCGWGRLCSEKMCDSVGQKFKVAIVAFRDSYTIVHAYRPTGYSDVMFDDRLTEYNERMNEWNRLLAEIKNLKLNANNNIKQYIHQRCYQVTNNIYGKPKSLNSS